MLILISNTVQRKYLVVLALLLAAALIARVAHAWPSLTCTATKTETGNPGQVKQLTFSSTYGDFSCSGQGESANVNEGPYCITLSYTISASNALSWYQNYFKAAVKVEGTLRDALLGGGSFSLTAYKEQRAAATSMSATLKYDTGTGSVSGDGSGIGSSGLTHVTYISCGAPYESGIIAIVYTQIGNDGTSTVTVRLSGTVTWASESCGGGGSPPPSTATLTVQLYRVDAGGNGLGPAAGAQVRVGGTTYTADSEGRVSVTVSAGSTVSVEVLQTTLSSGWQRYTFWRWGDGSTSNPRSFTVSSSTTVTAYVYDERLLKVTWEGPGVVTVNGTQVSNGWASWYRYGSAAELRAAPSTGSFEKWMRGVNGGQLADYSTANPITVAMDNGYQLHAVFKPVVQLTLSTTFLPGEALPLPWLLKPEWGWSGTWWVNVTEYYSGEHLVAVLWDGSEVKVVGLANNTQLPVSLPQGWQYSSCVVDVGGRKLLKLISGCLPKVNWSGGEWGLAFLAAWNPYKQDYNTSCWQSNGTSLAVYNVTFTYTFQNGTRVTFIQPVVVSTVRVTATPVYSYGDLKQSLSLSVNVAWKYLPPKRPGLKLAPPPPALAGVVNFGNGSFATGWQAGYNETSRNFTVTLALDTWEMYKAGVLAARAEAWWLGPSGQPQTPAWGQEPLQLSFAYAMPYIAWISEGTSFQADVEFIDVKTGQHYTAWLRLEFRRWSDYAVVARSDTSYKVSTLTRITINLANTKDYVLVIYAEQVSSPRPGLVVVPIAAVYPPRA
jgi:hypothetical protein